MVGVEFLGQQAQETLAPGLVQRQIAAPERGGTSAGGDLAAAAIEAAQHLLPQPGEIVLRQVRPGRARQHAARRAGDLAPGGAQIGQGSVEHPVEKAGAGRTVVHLRSALGEARDKAHTALRASAPCLSAAKAEGNASTRSSATSPGPKWRAASACSQTAADAASKAGMPCANRPTTMPARTSPDPAVASSGGAPSLIAVRPSGVATTVSLPFSSITAPLSWAARRARSSLLPASLLPDGSRLPNRRANSPSCGVNTQGERIVPNRTSALSAKLVSASASSTARFFAARTAHTFARVSSPTPAPGPISAAFRRGSASRCRKSSRPATGCTRTWLRLMA